MSTAGDICQTACEEIRAYGPGQTITSADMTRCLDQLNKMIDTFSNDDLICFTTLEQSFQLTVGKVRYTIGTSGGADLNQSRPLKILDLPGSCYTQDFNLNNYQISVVTRDKWNQLGNRSPTLMQSDIVTTLFYDPQFPLGVINVYPSPTINYTVFFDSYQRLSNLSQSTQLSLPPGYEEMYQHNLCLRIQPFFKNAVVNADTLRLARSTYRGIKRTNRKTVLAQVDPEIVASARTASYNIYTDSYNR